MGYMEVEKLKDMVGDLKFCDACFTGKYPMEVPEKISVWHLNREKGEYDYEQ